MDREGLDLAILFPTAAMYITAFDTTGPALRGGGTSVPAYNDWLYDDIRAADPARESAYALAVAAEARAAPNGPLNGGVRLLRPVGVPGAISPYLV